MDVLACILQSKEHAEPNKGGTTTFSSLIGDGEVFFAFSQGYPSSGNADWVTFIRRDQDERAFRSFETGSSTGAKQCAKSTRAERFAH
ncbi:hypothetical protein D3C73_954290 [compost metagenome]